MLIRGAGWAPDLFLRSSEERMREEFRYVRHMGLNTVRYEGSSSFSFSLSQHLNDIQKFYQENLMKIICIGLLMKWGS